MTRQINNIGRNLHNTAKTEFLYKENVRQELLSMAKHLCSALIFTYSNITLHAYTVNMLQPRVCKKTNALAM